MRRFKSLFIICLLVTAVFFIFSSASGLPFHKQEKGEAILDSLSYMQIGRVKGNRIVIDKKVDLRGKICQIPRGYTLVFKGGMLENGYLEGNQTKIEGDSTHIFNRVTIKGKWNVPVISTRMFADLNYENSLRDVVALSDVSVNNHILIDDGEYVMKVSEEAEKCINLNSNTTIEIHGNIKLLPNPFKSYSIIYAEGSNINVTGDGTVIGDKDQHTGTKGEWGTGIDFEGAKNSTAEGLTIKDCWGDCIYVGRNSKYIVIDNCHLDNGRRQGISITKADGVTIRNSTIENVGGTKPEFAIDLEPNGNCVVDHVLIENVKVENCEGGIVTSKGTKMVETKRIGEVVIRNCVVSSKSKYPMSIKFCEKATIENCTLYENSADAVIFSKECDELFVKNNVIYLGPEFVSSVNGVKEAERTQPIKIISYGYQEVIGNVIKK